MTGSILGRRLVTIVSPYRVVISSPPLGTGNVPSALEDFSISLSSLLLIFSRSAEAMVFVFVARAYPLVISSIDIRIRSEDSKVFFNFLFHFTRVAVVPDVLFLRVS